MFLFFVTTVSPRIGPKYQADLPDLQSRNSEELGKQSDHADICHRHVEPFQCQFGITPFIFKFSFNLFMLKIAGVSFPTYAEEQLDYNMDDLLHQSTSSEMETDSEIDTDEQDNTEIRTSQNSTIPEMDRVRSQSRMPVSRLINTGGLILPSFSNYTDDYFFSPEIFEIEYFQTESFGYVQSGRILPQYEATPRAEHIIIYG